MKHLDNNLRKDTHKYITNIGADIWQNYKRFKMPTYRQQQAT
jgi:hypothetical protein